LTSGDLPIRGAAGVALDATMSLHIRFQQEKVERWRKVYQSGKEDAMDLIKRRARLFVLIGGTFWLVQTAWADRPQAPGDTGAHAEEVSREYGTRGPLGKAFSCAHPRYSLVCGQIVNPKK